MLKHIKSWYTPLLKGFQSIFQEIPENLDHQALWLVLWWAVWSLEKKQRHQLQVSASRHDFRRTSAYRPRTAFSLKPLSGWVWPKIRHDMGGCAYNRLGHHYPYPLPVWFLAWIEIAEFPTVCGSANTRYWWKIIRTFPGVWKDIAAEYWIQPLHFVFFSLQCILHFQQAILILALDLISDDDFNAIQVSAWFIWISKYSKKQMHPLWSGWYTPEANMIRRPRENDDLQMTGKKLRYPGLCLCFLA